MMKLRMIVEGDYACYTRPELKVERTSYDVPTPSAMEGLLKSIYWKPAMKYVIDKIVIYNPIEFVNVRRNEVKSKVSMMTLIKSANGKNADPRIYTNKVRSQKNTRMLKNVKYGVEFHIELTGIKSEREGADADVKHFDIIRRRIENGLCYRTPCLGLAELPVRTVKLVENFNEEPISEEILALGDKDLGYMCYRVEFLDGGLPIDNDWEHPIYSDAAVTSYYRPHMVNGVIDIHKYRKEGVSY